MKLPFDMTNKIETTWAEQNWQRHALKKLKRQLVDNIEHALRKVEMRCHPRFLNCSYLIYLDVCWYRLMAR
jgi:hypothetical protein